MAIAISPGCRDPLCFVDVKLSFFIKIQLLLQIPLLNGHLLPDRKTGRGEQKEAHAEESQPRRILNPKLPSPSIPGHKKGKDRSTRTSTQPHHIITSLENTRI